MQTTIVEKFSDDDQKSAVSKIAEVCYLQFTLPLYILKLCRLILCIQAAIAFDPATILPDPFKVSPIQDLYVFMID